MLHWRPDSLQNAELKRFFLHLIARFWISWVQPLSALLVLYMNCHNHLHHCKANVCQCHLVEKMVKEHETWF